MYTIPSAAQPLLPSPSVPLFAPVERDTYVRMYSTVYYVYYILNHIIFNNIIIHNSYTVYMYYNVETLGSSTLVNFPKNDQIFTKGLH